MVSIRSIIALATSLSLASAAAIPEIEAMFHAALLKRQEPGTPLYACHLACGTAVTLSRGTNPCIDGSFLVNYVTCLECADPTIQNIWRYYGTTLTAAGSACGLSTTPVPAA